MIMQLYIHLLVVYNFIDILWNKLDKLVISIIQVHYLSKFLLDL